MPSSHTNTRSHLKCLSGSSHHRGPLAAENETLPCECGPASAQAPGHQRAATTPTPA